MVKNGCDQSGQGILKFFLKNEQMEEPVFCILTQIQFLKKSRSISFRVGMIKNGCDQSSQGTLKFTVSQK